MCECEWVYGDCGWSEDSVGLKGGCLCPLAFCSLDQPEDQSDEVNQHPRVVCKHQPSLLRKPMSEVRDPILSGV